MKTILQKEEKVLRKIAKEIPLSDITSSKIKKILKEMSESLASQHDGVAIAAPQIGYSLRIFVVSGKIFEKDFMENRANNIPNTKTEQKNILKDLVFINPKISRLSREKEWLPEGCLSVRPLYGKTFRSKKATATAYDENGKKFTRGASGLLAQIFQHETDHLDGILFIDHAKDIKEENID
jgi:peptide deformylase